MTEASAPAIPEASLQRRWLLQFLMSLRVLAATFAALELAIAWLLRHWPLAVIGAGTLLAFLSTFPARRLTRRGRPKEAASLAGYSILFAGSVAGPLAPYGTACLVLVPMLAVAAVLPYLSGRQLLVFLVVAFVDTMWIVTSAWWLSNWVQIPEQIGRFFGVLGTTAPAFMLLLLLWQFSVRLRSTLSEAVAARRRAELAHAEAERAIEHRDLFLSVASHELRTPLMSLQLAVDGLTKGVVPATPQNVDRALVMIARQAKKLTVLVADMLTVGRIQLGRLELHQDWLDLSELVREVAGRFSADLVRAGSPLEVDAKRVMGFWDRERLDQVVTNLLSNAIKFGEGKPITVRVGTQGALARLSVQDQGIGIDPERLPRVFGKFERAVSARQYGGLGLGLFIVSAIVHAHGGVIWADSPGPGGGTTLVVELPSDAVTEKGNAPLVSAEGQVAP